MCLPAFGPARQDLHRRLLHLLPELVRDDVWSPSCGERLPLDVADQLLVRPHRLLGAGAELSVDRARLEPEIGEPLLKADHVITKRSPQPRWKPAVQPPAPSQRFNGHPHTVGIGTRGDHCV